MLEHIHSPTDIKMLTRTETETLAAEIRKAIIDTVSKNGGHLASNLGMVEATIALHKHFDSPRDKIIFDVSHQCYAHKLLTGRYNDFHTLRQSGGISGFTNRAESDHDILTEGHSGASISAALGIATANKLAGNDAYTVAVLGDGSLTNGMIYEAFNNCAGKDLNLIILLNDNDMSISRNIGGLHEYLSKIRTSKRYYRLKHRTEKILSAIPLIGRPILVGSKKLKDATKRFFVKNNIFEDLGLIYLGPVDGHNPEKLDIVLAEAKTKHTYCIVHMVTKKGLGYSLSENEPDRYHGVGAFDQEKGVTASTSDTFSTKVGEILCETAEKDEKVCAITAAMCDGTGLASFSQAHPERFFDVGIAEEHAITFASGLAVSGMKPVVLLYSTFAQRVYDQLSHDVAIQRLPFILALDRAGLVPNDGITHQGIFDYNIFSTIPNTEIFSPETYDELKNAFSHGFASAKITVIRYPKGSYQSYEPAFPMIADGNTLAYTKNIETAETVIVTFGRMTKTAHDAIKLSDKNIGLLKLIQIFPLDYKKIASLLRNAKNIYFLEEGYRSGGVSEKIAAYLQDKNIKIHAIENFVDHGNLADLNHLCGFTAEKICQGIAPNPI